MSNGDIVIFDKKFESVLDIHGNFQIIKVGVKACVDYVLASNKALIDISKAADNIEKALKTRLNKELAK